jgi:hypothetical protein
MTGDYWIRWNSVVRIRFFSNRLVSEEALQSSTGCQYYGARSRSMVLAENVMEAEIWGPAMVVRVFVARRNWLC